MDSLWKIIQFISDKLKVIGAASLVGMTALTCVDVVGRYFKHPVFGSVELVTFMGVFSVAMALPFTHDTKGHIGVELFVIKLPSKTRAFIDLVTGLLSLVLFSIVMYQMFEYGAKMSASGEVSMNLELPEYMIIYIVAFCFVVFSLMIVKGIVESFSKLRGK
jgi:TRAP-type C4-dicarboxylate transport system permease small subunit